jgi:hypothetical protein
VFLVRYRLVSYNRGHFLIFCLLHFLTKRIISRPFSESNPARNLFAVWTELVDEKTSEEGAIGSRLKRGFVTRTPRQTSWSMRLARRVENLSGIQ